MESASTIPKLYHALEGFHTAYVSPLRANAYPRKPSTRSWKVVDRSRSLTYTIRCRNEPVITAQVTPSECVQSIAWHVSRRRADPSMELPDLIPFFVCQCRHQQVTDPDHHRIRLEAEAARSAVVLRLTVTNIHMESASISTDRTRIRYGGASSSTRLQITTASAW